LSKSDVGKSILMYFHSFLEYVDVYYRGINMNMSVRVKFNLRCLYGNTVLFFVSLLFMVVMISSPLVSVYSGVSPFVIGADSVNNASELEAAIAAPGEKFVITFGADITLDETLVIPDGKDITLKSRTDEFKLIGAADKSTIAVESNGLLEIDGIIVTHAKGDMGNGVSVASDATLMLSSGMIVNNTVDGCGGGVYNMGVFEMYGGKIFGNSAYDGGGGVYTCGVFKLFGGDITNNTAIYGGSVLNDGGSFNMDDGKISDSTASVGGGVYTTSGTFTMSNGEIYNNTAASGGGVYTYYGTFYLDGGRVSSNTATGNGGGVGVPDRSGLGFVYVSRGVTFSNNRASASYDRDSDDDDVYNSQIKGIVWSSPFTQGYNNYDINYLPRGNSSDDSGSSSNNNNKDDDNTTTLPSSTAIPSNSVMPSEKTGDGVSDYLWQIIVAIVLVGVLVGAVLFFYRPNKNVTAVEKNLSA